MVVALCYYAEIEAIELIAVSSAFDMVFTIFVLALVIAQAEAFSLHSSFRGSQVSRLKGICPFCYFHFIYYDQYHVTVPRWRLATGDVMVGEVLRFEGDLDSASAIFKVRMDCTFLLFIHRNG